MIISRWFQLVGLGVATIVGNGVRMNGMKILAQYNPETGAAFENAEDVRANSALNVLSVSVLTHNIVVAAAGAQEAAAACVVVLLGNALGAALRWMATGVAITCKTLLYFRIAVVLMSA